jgi:hypothetical protein
MIRILNDLKTICAWGRWRVGNARNEPRVAFATGQRRGLRVAAQSSVDAKITKLRRPRPRLHLVPSPSRGNRKR